MMMVVVFSMETNGAIRYLHGALGEQMVSWKYNF
jgi:hypothetical protein